MFDSQARIPRNSEALSENSKEVKNNIISNKTRQSKLDNFKFASLRTNVLLPSQVGDASEIPLVQLESVDGDTPTGGRAINLARSSSHKSLVDGNKSFTGARPSSHKSGGFLDRFDTTQDLIDKSQAVTPATPCTPKTPKAPPRKRRASLKADFKDLGKSPEEKERERMEAMGEEVDSGFKQSLKEPADHNIEHKPNLLYRGVGMCCSMVPLLHPSDPLVERWDVVMIFMLTYVAILAPYETAYLNTKVDVVFVFNRFIDLGFVMDMVMQFNLAYPGKYGRLIRDRAEIVRNYFRTWLPVDLMSIIPFDTLSLGIAQSLGNLQVLRVVRLFRLFKMLRLLRANRMFARFEARIAIQYSLLQLQAFLIALCMLCHWLACGWYMVLVIEQNEECISLNPYDDRLSCCYNWLDCYPFSDLMDGRTASRKYFLSLWFSTAEVLTVSSDIFAITDAERAYQIVVRILSGVVYAYLIGAVCNIFTSLQKEQTRFFESMDKLNSFLKSQHLNELDEDLCASLRTFYRFSHTCHKGSNSAMKDIMGTITPNLKGQLAYKVHSKWLHKIVIFQELQVKFSNQFYVSLALALEERIYATMENVIEPHSPCVELIHLEKGIMLCRGRIFMMGECFGEECFWAVRDAIRGYTATLLTHGKVTALNMDKFYDIIERPQFMVEKRLVRKRIVRLQCAELVISFKTVLYEGTIADNFQNGCALVRARLGYVNTGKLPVILQIFARVWARFHEEDKDLNFDRIITSTMRRRGSTRSVMENFKRDEIVDIQNRVRDILQPVGLQDFAERLVDREELDAEALLDVTAEQMRYLGASWEQAVEFRKHVAYLKWSKQQQESKQQIDNSEIDVQLSINGVEDKDRSLRVRSVHSYLAKYKLEKYATVLAGDEYMDVEMIESADVRQLSAAGLPLGLALEYVKKRNEEIELATKNRRPGTVEGRTSKDFRREDI